MFGYRKLRRRKWILPTAVLLAFSGVRAQQTAVIGLNPGIRYQTIRDWEATAWAAQDDPAFSNFKNTLFDEAALDLKISRLRLEVRSGSENPRDYWAEYRAGQISYQTWRCVRYSALNDNDDPNTINWQGFHWSELDDTVERVVLPMKQRVEAQGRKLMVNVNYVAFTNQMHEAGCEAGLQYAHGGSPEEYGEFVLAAYVHLQQKYGWVPDTWEVILEPDNTSYWGGTQIGQAIVAAAGRLKAYGFTPKFIAPSTTNLSNAVSYFDAISAVPGALPYLEELSYHRYSGVSDSALQEIARRGRENGIATAMLEHVGSGYGDLHQDLKTGGNSSWQQYALGGGGSDDGGTYYKVDTSDPSRPSVRIGSRTKFLRQYFKFIQRGAVRIESASSNSAFDPVAFLNPDGSWVAVIKAGAQGDFNVTGFPAGSYKIKYTTAGLYDMDAPEVSLAAGQALHASIPDAGVLTIFGMPLPLAPPDTSPPSVGISSPAAQALLSGNVLVQASASDDTGVAGVQFLLNGAALGAEDTTAPYSAAWQTASFPNGTYRLAARARDMAGNQRTSQEIAVTVFNGAPALSENLLLDPGFENGGALWQRSSFGGRSVTLTQFHSGASSQQILLSSQWDRMVFQDAPTAPGSRYEASGWAMASGAGGGGAQIRLLWLTAAGLPGDLPAGSVLRTDIVGTVAGTGGWIRLDGVFTAPDGAQAVRFELRTAIEPDDAGSAWFDDLRLSAILGNVFPAAVFRDGKGRSLLLSYGSAAISSAGGTIASDLASAQNGAGDTYIAGINPWSQVWLNVFRNGTRAWNGWQLAGNGKSGNPALAVRSAGDAYVVARDSSYRYWLNPYRPEGGFGGWLFLGGSFATDPVAAAAPGGPVYVLGVDPAGKLWSGRYVPGSGFGGWIAAGGTMPAVQGKPAITIGSDGAAYVAIRASDNAAWMARLEQGAWGPWYSGGGTLGRDPEIAATGGSVYAAVTNLAGVVYVQPFQEGSGNGWRGWIYDRGILDHVSIAAAGGRYFLTGKNAARDLWWYQSGGSGWSNFGYRGLAANDPAASPK